MLGTAVGEERELSEKLGNDTKSHAPGAAKFTNTRVTCIPATVRFGAVPAVFNSTRAIICDFNEESTKSSSFFAKSDRT